MVSGDPLFRFQPVGEEGKHEACDIDKSSYFWAKTCGVCHPGGGPCEYDRKGNRYDEFARDPENNILPRGDNYLDGDYYRSDWEKSGVLEADCLICHLKGYNWKKRLCC